MVQKNILVTEKQRKVLKRLFIEEAVREATKNIKKNLIFMDFNIITDKKKSYAMDLRSIGVDEVFMVCEFSKSVHRYNTNKRASL